MYNWDVKQKIVNPKFYYFQPNIILERNYIKDSYLPVCKTKLSKTKFDVMARSRKRKCELKKLDPPLTEKKKKSKHIFSGEEVVQWLQKSF